MGARVEIFEGRCHACNARILVSQPRAAIHDVLRVPSPLTMRGRGLCPICGKRAEWKRVAYATREGGKS